MATQLVERREVFRVCLWDHDTQTAEFKSFVEAVRYIRGIYPQVNFNQQWTEMPPALNGDEASDLPFGQSGQTLGNLLHLRLVK